MRLALKSRALLQDHPAAWCYELPENVTIAQGALCEPLSVGIHGAIHNTSHHTSIFLVLTRTHNAACRRGEVRPGTRVAILGAGPIGLVSLIAANVFGAGAVAITDLKPFNLEMATSLGATHALLVSRAETPGDTSKRLAEALGGPPDVVIDCCGFESSMATAIDACATGGRVVLVGMGCSHSALLRRASTGI